MDPLQDYQPHEYTTIFLHGYDAIESHVDLFKDGDWGKFTRFVLPQAPKVIRNDGQKYYSWIDQTYDQQSDVVLDPNRDFSPDLDDDEIDPEFRKALKNLGLNDDQIREYYQNYDKVRKLSDYWANFDQNELEQ